MMPGPACPGRFDRAERWGIARPHGPQRRGTPQEPCSTVMFPPAVESDSVRLAGVTLSRMIPP
jgi:hypothetical protein